MAGAVVGVVVARRRGRGAPRRCSRRSAGRPAAAWRRARGRARGRRRCAFLALSDFGASDEVDRRLGERELALGQADVLDRLGGGDRHLERARVGVADVLGGEDDHPPHDEARVLAALEHHREVVEAGVGVRAARGLDPGRDRVVVAVAGLVVGQRAALQRVLGRLRASPGRGVWTARSKRRQRRARVAAGARGQEGDRVVVGLGAERLRRARRRTTSMSPASSARSS